MYCHQTGVNFFYNLQSLGTNPFKDVNFPSIVKLWGNDATGCIVIPWVTKVNYWDSLFIEVVQILFIKEKFIGTYCYCWFLWYGNRLPLWRQNHYWNLMDYELQKNLRIMHEFMYKRLMGLWQNYGIMGIMTKFGGLQYQVTTKSLDSKEIEYKMYKYKYKSLILVPPIFPSWSLWI